MNKYQEALNWFQEQICAEKSDFCKSIKCCPKECSECSETKYYKTLQELIDEYETTTEALMLAHKMRLDSVKELMVCEKALDKACKTIRWKYDKCNFSKTIGLEPTFKCQQNNDCESCWKEYLLKESENV